MSVNYVDYDVLLKGVSTYKAQADQLKQLTQALYNMNGELEQGWNNKTAAAFIQRFNSDFGPKLTNAAEAIDEISNYINQYLNQRQDEDAENASLIS